MDAETQKEDVSQKQSQPIDFSDFTKPITVSELKEGLEEKLEGAVTGICKHTSMKNKEGQEEKNLIGLTAQQRKALGVVVNDYVNVIIDGEGTVRRYMVVKGLTENIGKDLFTANGIPVGKKISVQK